MLELTDCCHAVSLVEVVGEVILGMICMVPCWWGGSLGRVTLVSSDPNAQSCLLWLEAIQRVHPVLAHHCWGP